MARGTSMGGYDQRDRMAANCYASQGAPHGGASTAAASWRKDRAALEPHGGIEQVSAELPSQNRQGNPKNQMRGLMEV